MTCSSLPVKEPSIRFPLCEEIECKDRIVLRIKKIVGLFFRKNKHISGIAPFRGPAAASGRLRSGWIRRRCADKAHLRAPPLPFRESGRNTSGARTENPGAPTRCAGILRKRTSGRSDLRTGGPNDAATAAAGRSAEGTAASKRIPAPNPYIRLKEQPRFLRGPDEAGASPMRMIRTGNARKTDRNRRLGYRLTATASISTRAPIGSAAAW